mmetsp:Transcript_15120/g.41854  ORF Transcript_15120/g.41854 Transcript_15120/m.41854 type:complete len:168 (-) Transcript_15120:394-897(-)
MGQTGLSQNADMCETFMDNRTHTIMPQHSGEYERTLRGNVHVDAEAPRNQSLIQFNSMNQSPNEGCGENGGVENQFESSACSFRECFYVKHAFLPPAPALILLVMSPDQIRFHFAFRCCAWHRWNTAHSFVHFETCPWFCVMHSATDRYTSAQGPSSLDEAMSFLGT